MNQGQLDYMDAVFFLLEETDVVSDAVEDWAVSWEPWGPFQTLEQFIQAWHFLALKESALSDVGFFAVWDSVKHIFPDYMDEGLRRHPPQPGDVTTGVMSSMLRDDGFESFSEDLWLVASDGEGELEDDDATVENLAAWWDSERGRTLETVWGLVSSLDLPLDRDA